MGNLNKLTELYLGSAKLSGNFPHVLLNLSSLTLIELQFNQFEGILPSNMSNLSKLESFEIVGNSFSGTIPSSLGNLSYLAHVFLNDNSFSGTIPSSLFMIPSLIGLDLARNYFSGLLEIGNISSLSKLQYLFLGENNFNGPIPRFISKLVNLQRLSLSFWNTGSGMVDFSIFLHPKSLWSLDLSYLNTRSMVDLSCFSHLMLLELDLSGDDLKISSTLHFPSPMYTLILSSCNIYEFPKFLQNQTSLDYLDISANQIEGQVPDWLWRLPKLRHVNIAQNSFSGFEGSAEVIQRSGNLTKLPNFIEDFLGSDNRFSGEILGQYVNCLAGVFPEESISVNLRSLDVGSNWLSGQLPKSLINCTDLEFLNVEDNRISDKFPFWLRSLPNLQILVLRSNKFYGPISSPGDSLSVPTLRIFDISENGFNGVLPSDYFVGWSAMSSVVDIYDNTPGIGVVGGGRKRYHNSVVLTNKGLTMELVGSGFTIYRTIDVSGNRFEGDIPESIGLLKELIVLNMSNNAFTGHIPPSLSNLSNLQSLDISKNRLSGSISPELGKLTFLEWMNFSLTSKLSPSHYEPLTASGRSFRT
ncbi:receptor-like protein 12 [Arabidopsis lyrata subsp. lyrata]|uniref:receptor-like protein 12 n=1 Tax=Arabidopsis lyrata subsp. lyrata TaxID=81972 RepID=UPI000A29E5BE|nr:receptor-like protein 12 [Arabidopsis lyrata subsp. lyrata]|eukprot:XP_020874090.1 receptor-like protein 12 [Arabidopsis lyrata subsp. lyrata]